MSSARLAPLFSIVGLALFGACSTPPEAAPISSVTASVLPAGILATVGTTSITQEVVLATAAAQGISPRSALLGETRDAVFARGALERGDAESLAVRAAIRGRLARARLESLHREAAKDEPSDDEVALATARHFAELNRPETFRVIHALVKVAHDADTTRRAEARALAERVAQSTASATDAETFRSHAESTPNQGNFEIVVEALNPVAADGRVIDPAHLSAEPGQLVPPFALAASRLSVPGQKSDIVTTNFGFHVLMLLERLPAHVVPIDERRRTLHDEIVTERAKRLKKELILRLRQATPVAVERSVDSILGAAPVGNDERP